MFAGVSPASPYQCVPFELARDGLSVRRSVRSQGSRPLAGGSPRQPAWSRSAPDHLVRTARVDDPIAGVTGDPACQLLDAAEVELEVAVVHRFVVGDPVP